MKYPEYISPEGKVYACIGWACGLPKLNWEWYAFEHLEEDIYWGYVMGFENEYGSFSIKELSDNGIRFYTEPSDLNQLEPPLGWNKVNNTGI